MRNKVAEARRDEVGYCGIYCRTCHWYTDVMRRPASQLLDVVKSHFEVAMWIDAKGGKSKQTLKGLDILSKSACTYNCKGGGGWDGCPVRKCCTVKGFDFCFECSEFPCEGNWSEKSEHASIFTANKIKRLQEMKEIGVEEWIRRQWQ